MKKWICLLLCAALLLLCACAPPSEGPENPGTDPGIENPGDGEDPGGQDDPDDPVGPAVTYYTNPVFEPIFADPTVIRHTDGTFYAYATSDYSTWDGENRASRTALIPIIKSDDLVNWEYVGDVFNASNRPNWRPASFGIWAPDIIRIGDTYNLYYSFAGWADAQNSAIGVATAPHPEGPWTDHGMVVDTPTTGVQQSIDSFTFEYEGGIYMIWGSYYGMFYIELTADGLAVKAGAKAVQIGGRTNFSTYEAAWLTQYGDYWYLFTSHGNCCEGLNTNYYVQAFRADSPFGPYYGEDGKPMLGSGLGTNVIRNNADFVGCGHNAVIQDDAGDYWIVYHGYDTSQPGTVDGTNRRALCIDKLYWDGGWPHTQDNGASSGETVAPYILPAEEQSA